jgi:hypothetical protein
MSPRGHHVVTHVAAAALGAAAVAWLGPPGADLAAHVYQRAFFLEHGFSVWNNFWYAGRYSYITYSLVYYPLAALVGIKALAVVTAAVAAGAFAALVDREWPAAGRWPSRSFTAVSAATVLTGAYPYALGVAFALLALVMLRSGRTRWFTALVVATFAASPLAFALLVVVLVAVATARRTHARLPVVAVVATATAGVVLWRAFPDPGRFPFPPLELAASLVFCGLGVAFTWRVPSALILRYLFVAYGVACVVAFAVPSPVGENVARLRFFAIPLAVLALSLRHWRPLAPALAALALAVSWNFTPLAFSFAHMSSDPSAEASYWRPIVRFLSRSLTPDYRVEVVATTGHWEATYLARAGIPLTRGWFRQDDFPQNRILYGDLSGRSYVRWLRRLGVEYVVLTDSPADYSARGEARLLRRPCCGLVRVHTTRHAAIFAVRHPEGIISGAHGAHVLALRTASALLEVPKPARYRIALRWAPYWTARGACVARGRDGMIELVARRAGDIRLRFDVSARRALSAVAGAQARCG